MLKIIKTSNKSKARRGVLKTAHGMIQTPFFMPIGTKGAVKNLDSQELSQLGAEIILSNTYHLYLKPGEKIIKKFGGLHKFMNWPKPILTDSGGYQVFSLGGNKGKKENLVQITTEGVHFRSYLDGSKHFFTPENVINIQRDLGVDIMMCLDICPALPSTQEKIKEAVELTTHWAKLAVNEWSKKKGGQLLFGIVQGGTNMQMRKKSAQELTQLPFSGFAIGGLAVGEEREEMYKVLKYLPDLLPKEKPRYLMGVGRPEEIVQAVKSGIDMFDCVIPTREARHGRLYMFCPKGQKGAIKLFGDIYYKMVNINNSEYRLNKFIINPKSKITLLNSHSFGYLYHLLKTDEGLGYRIATLQNLSFYLTLMKVIRLKIDKGAL